MNTDIVVNEYRKQNGSSFNYFALRSVFREYAERFSSLPPEEEFMRLNYLMYLVINKCGGDRNINGLSDKLIREAFEDQLSYVIFEVDTVLEQFRYMPGRLQGIIEKSLAIFELAKISLGKLIEDDEFIRSEAKRLYDELVESKNEHNENPYVSTAYVKEVYDKMLEECNADIQFIMNHERPVSELSDRVRQLLERNES